jgi:hypothetical protein
MPKHKSRLKPKGSNNVDLATGYSVIKAASPPRKPSMLAYKDPEIKKRLEDPRTNPIIIPTLQTVGRKLGMELTATEGYRTKVEQTKAMRKKYSTNRKQYETNYGKLPPDINPFVSKHLLESGKRPSAADIRLREWPKKSTTKQIKTFTKDLEAVLKSLDFSIFAKRAKLPTGKLEEWNPWAARMKKEGKKGVHVHGEASHIHFSFTDDKAKSILSKAKPKKKIK